MICYCFLRRVSTPRADVPSIFPLLHVCTQASPKGLSPEKPHLNTNNEQCLHIFFSPSRLFVIFSTLVHYLTILPTLLSITCRSRTSTCIITKDDQFICHPSELFLFCFVVFLSCHPCGLLKKVPLYWKTRAHLDLYACLFSLLLFLQYFCFVFAFAKRITHHSFWPSHNVPH